MIHIYIALDQKRFFFLQNKIFGAGCEMSESQGELLEVSRLSDQQFPFWSSAPNIVCQCERGTGLNKTLSNKKDSFCCKSETNFIDICYFIILFIECFLFIEEENICICRSASSPVLRISSLVYSCWFGGLDKANWLELKALFVNINDQNIEILGKGQIRINPYIKSCMWLIFDNQWD